MASSAVPTNFPHRFAPEASDAFVAEIREGTAAGQFSSLSVGTEVLIFAECVRIERLSSATQVRNLVATETISFTDLVEVVVQPWAQTTVATLTLVEADGRRHEVILRKADAEAAEAIVRRLGPPSSDT